MNGVGHYDLLVPENNSIPAYSFMAPGVENPFELWQETNSIKNGTISVSFANMFDHILPTQASHDPQRKSEQTTNSTESVESNDPPQKNEETTNSTESAQSHDDHSYIFPADVVSVPRSPTSIVNDSTSEHNYGSSKNEKKGIEQRKRGRSRSMKECGESTKITLGKYYPSQVKKTVPSRPLSSNFDKRQKNVMPLEN